MTFASSKPHLLLPISCLGNSPLPHGGRAPLPQTVDLGMRARGERIIDPEKSHLRESLPGQKVGTPSKQEVGPRDTPITTPGDATEILSTGTEDEGADLRAHR